MGTQAVRDQVFISYSKQTDTAFARRLAKILKAASFNVWLDEEQIAAADDYQRVLQAALAESRQAVFVVSPRWLEREWTRYELATFAQNATGRRRVAILRFPRGRYDVGPHLNLLHDVEWLDGTDQEAACVWQVICGLTGEKPGPAEDWARQGAKRLAALNDLAPEGLALPAGQGAARARRRATEPRDRDGLYLSCDRAEQWNSFTEVMGQRRHQVIMLPGARGEAHDEFMRRIENRLPPDPPRRIVKVTWSEYPCPGQAELLLADLALALDVEEAALPAALRDELVWRNLILLQPPTHCLNGPALADYLTRLLPGCLTSAGEARFSLKVVQPVEWVAERLGARIAGWIRTLAVGSAGRASRSAAAFMDRVAESASPELSVVRLPELGAIERRHLEAFCEANQLPRARRAVFIDEVLRGARCSRDVLFNIQREFPRMELT